MNQQQLMQLQNSTVQPKKGHQTDKYQGTFHTTSKLRHGKGIYTYDNPFFSFQGNYENGKKNGEGILKFKDGRVIRATFEDDQILGKAQIIYPDGSKYIGNLHLGEKDGEGTYSSLFQTYQGQWKDNCKHGVGTFQNHSNNSRYQGQYANDKPHGEGHLTKWNYEYKGNFNNGYKNGQGHQINDWNRQQGGVGRYEYKGQFKQDKFSGTGQFKSRESKYIYRGLFTSGLPNLYPNEFRCYISINSKNGEQIVQGQKTLLVAQPIQYQLEGDSFNLYIDTVYQGPEVLDQVQPTQQEIDLMVKNWQNENKKNKNPPPMPDFNQPRMKKPDMVIVTQETGRPIEIRLIKQVESKEEYLKVDYRAQIVAKRKQNQELRQQALKKAQEQGNKKGGKKDSKGQAQLKVNIFKENPNARQKVLHLWTQDGKCSLSKIQFPDDFPQGKYYLQLRSTFKDFGQIKVLKKEINIKSKVVKKK